MTAKTFRCIRNRDHDTCGLGFCRPKAGQQLQRLSYLTIKLGDESAVVAVCGGTVSRAAERSQRQRFSGEGLERRDNLAHVSVECLRAVQQLRRLQTARHGREGVTVLRVETDAVSDMVPCSRE